MGSIFNYLDYKEYLVATEKKRASVQKGFRSRLAELLNCQNAYISQVFNTNSHFSLEQGIKISNYLQMSDVEQKYFLLLIEFARAGNQELQSYFKKEIDLLRNQMLVIKNRITEHAEIRPQDQNIYYSSWIYGATHMLTTIPQFKTISEIALALQIPLEFAQKIILFLVSAGLITEKKGKFSPGQNQIHLSRDSAHLKQHHMNLRICAMQSLQFEAKNDIHYSTMSTLSEETAQKIKNDFVEMIQNYVDTVKVSPEETLYNFNLDFYKMIHQKS